MSAPLSGGGGHDQPADEAWSRLEFAAATVGDQVDKNGGAALRDWFALLAEVRSVLAGRAAEVPSVSDQAPAAREADLATWLDWCHSGRWYDVESAIEQRLASTPQDDEQ